MSRADQLSISSSRDKLQVHPWSLGQEDLWQTAHQHLQALLTCHWPGRVLWSACTCRAVQLQVSPWEGRVCEQPWWPPQAPPPLAGVKVKNRFLINPNSVTFPNTFTSQIIQYRHTSRYVWLVYVVDSSICRERCLYSSTCPHSTVAPPFSSMRRLHPSHFRSQDDTVAHWLG